ncbi:oxidoreductase [Pseudoalteromonas piscicida]|uniref:Oxidoreductase n=1 Tax=Pseudoalteromonas piscicida TaxID=43662 RepID=A0AAQ2ETX7_PSEO7|nr:MULTISPECIES: aldo/keto reductase [Pseudoalteromonas]KJY87032.1 oxidoreductase [Pseudoalteromonas piscicida]TMN38609.1 oxidoreductase [Pseudoalteromonas piscicida]TMN45115.1 oxidoreductase [Pseudoalteromonas piscicida]TMN50094.1 oxidoreductase [Pseudoalteromonas piscicida]TMN51896.1 oxidoreductase [Pseudoalteromonas piscicida]
MNANTRVLDPLVLGFWRLLDWQITPQENLRFLKQAIELGIRDTDHADIYGEYQCEAEFGKALALEPSIREHIRIITKCGIKPAFPSLGLAGKANHYDSSKVHIIAQAQQSLKHFGTDRLDVLLIHRPDYLMDADEVADAFNTLKQNGDVLHFGVSNFTPSQLGLLQSRLDFALVTNQIEFSPYEMKALDDGTLDQCQQLGINPMLWSPLAGGRIFSSEDEKAKRLRAVLQQVGEEIGCTEIDQVIYAWLAMHPSKPATVLGTGNITRVASAFASQSLSMGREQWYRIWTASTGHSVP